MATATTTAPHDFRQHVLHHYNKYAAWYELGEFIRRGTRRKALELSGLQPGEKVLDLCTGTGELALKFVTAGAAVVGVDLARGALKIAQAKRAGSLSSWMEMEATRLGFAEKSFDISLLSLALHHMPESVQVHVLKEMCRVTRRRVVIVEPNVPVNPNWFQAYARVAAVIDESEYMNEWVEQDFLGTCTIAGLNVESMIDSTLGIHRIILCRPKNL